MTSPEDQQKFVIPLNRETEKIFHDLRMIIDAGVLDEPVTWQITKIHRLAPNGLIRATLAQTKFDRNKDFIELDDNGNVIGMWASFYEQIPQKPIEPPVEPIEFYSEISYSGVKPQVKIGGNYKKFTVTFYDKDNNVVEYQSGDWDFKIKRNPNTPEELIENCDDLIEVLYYGESSDLEENQIKLKFDGEDEYLGDILIISHKTENDIQGEIEMEIIGL